jgi:Tol biopolymer transport system component
VDVYTGVTREERRIEGHISSPPIVSPTGRRSSRTEPPGGLNVWTMDLAGGGRPHRDREGIGWPAWSPDGKTLAVELMRAATLGSA